jgi:hypothetical protein
MEPKFIFRNPLIRYDKKAENIIILDRTILLCGVCHRKFRYDGTQFSTMHYLVIGPTCRRCTKLIFDKKPEMRNVLAELNSKEENGGKHDSSG